MFFDKKNKNKKCEDCGSKINKNYSFCPHCGNSFANPKKEQEDFGLLGRNDFSEPESQDSFLPQGFGMMDKMLNSVMNSLMKNLDKQFRNQFRDVEKDFGNAEVKSFPNGIRIKVSGPFESKLKQKQKKKEVPQTRIIDKTKLKKMNTFPREKAKTNVKRIGDKVIYELLTPGVASPEDVFVSKLESGYEIKVIGSKKVYVNSVPINLPMKRYSILKNKLLVEFNSEQEG